MASGSQERRFLGKESCRILSCPTSNAKAFRNAAIGMNDSMLLPSLIWIQQSQSTLLHTFNESLAKPFQTCLFSYLSSFRIPANVHYCDTKSRTQEIRWPCDFSVCSTTQYDFANVDAAHVRYPVISHGLFGMYVALHDGRQHGCSVNMILNSCMSSICIF